MLRLIASMKQGSWKSSANFFSTSHSFEGWWEAGKLAFSSEFVEFVEEQRAKAA